MEIDRQQVGRDLKELYDRAEPSFKEFRTSEYIQTRLKGMGLTDYKTAGTGIFGTIDAGREETVALRSDMDALPFNAEKTEYRHLCGHHANMTTLLGILDIITKNRDRLRYNIRYIFQPAEELVSGSVTMIDAGCMEGVTKIFATHTTPDAELGSVALVYGGCMAGSNHFDIYFRGRATHAAMPHKGADTVTAACEFVTSMQMAVSRLIDPTLSGLISFGMIHGGSAANILPEEVYVSGTYRHFEPEVKDTIEKAIKTRLKSVEEFYGIETELIIHDGTPPVICDKELMDGFRQVCEETGIPISKYDSKSMGGEDFAFYLQHARGAFIWQGVSTGGGYHPPLHNKDYKVPEEAVYPCITLLSEYLLKG
ncbi:MAG: M20 family metallopeptidase [Deferribacterales bacterium]